MKRFLGWILDLSLPAEDRPKWPKELKKTQERQGRRERRDVKAEIEAKGGTVRTEESGETVVYTKIQTRRGEEEVAIYFRKEEWEGKSESDKAIMINERSRQMRHGLERHRGRKEE